MRDQPHLAPRPANHRPLTPLDFLDRALAVCPDRAAGVWRDCAWTYAGLGDIVARMVAFLRGQGVGPGDVVSVMLPNRPEMLAAHYAVPLLGAVLNMLNTRLDAAAVAWILTHSQSCLLLVFENTAAVGAQAAAQAGVALHSLATIDLPSGPAPALPLAAVAVERQPICLNYTSGATGHPKRVVYHHRGACLNALGNVVTLGLGRGAVYLWTLPMFHCNGWCHTWAVAAAGGLHVCLDRVDPADIFAAIARYGATHMASAPVVLYMLLNHPDRPDRMARPVMVASVGAAPSVALISGLVALGFDFLHMYGPTESHGPATLCALDCDQAALTAGAKAQCLSRQGHRLATAGEVAVCGDGGELPWDGAAAGEIALRGNTLMAGYWRDPDATEAAFAGGWLHTGDLAIRHPNGEIEISDRAKDVINSSLEVENALHCHPAVLLAAVVAAPDPKWSEVPCVFVEVKPGADLAEDDLRAHARAHLAGFRQPRRYVFGPLPRTETGKIQKFRLRADLRP